jgi:tRNA:m4X modification enzyme
MSHRGLGLELKKMENCAGATKHLSQSASILGNMERLGILSAPACFVEMGAGRGQFSH